MFYNLYARIYQTVLRIASYVTPWRSPKLIYGDKKCGELPMLIKKNNHKSVIIVTDKTILNLGLIDDLICGLEKLEIKYCIYADAVVNPTIENIEAGVEVYKNNNCDSIIAFGGGSPMDCAKGIGARISFMKKKIPQMKGLLKVRKRIPDLYAIPTTAGTGSEVTLASVITNSKTHEKYAINDICLIPRYAILDPSLTVNLPRNITATTGMDALTHAIEAYIGRSNTRKTKEYSKKAVKLIYENLYIAYSDGSNIEARMNMQLASYYAGLAFTRAYVGNIHAIAHTLGGFYSTPHGEANAIIMPYVLDYYGANIYKKLAELADEIGITDSNDSEKIKSRKFIDLIKNLNNSMNIAKKINDIKDEDIDLMVDRAYAEANPLYPVPQIFTKKDFENIYKQIKE